MAKTRHHYVPVTYLRAFAGPSGELLVYRKDAPRTPYPSRPENTAFERHYYSFETEAGFRDTDSFEDFFSLAETEWPNHLSAIESREACSDQLQKILEFAALQRSRVPANRDAYEAFQADSSLEALRFMKEKGKLPPPPKECEDILEKIEIAINPEISLKAIDIGLMSCEKIFNALEFSVLINETECEILTSDNPVIWYNPTVPDDCLRPYLVHLQGPIEFLFPLTPRLVLYGSTRWIRSGKGRLAYRNLVDKRLAKRINKMVSRFAYRAVFAKDERHQKIIEKYASASPVLVTGGAPEKSGRLIFSASVFGQRRKKAKWDVS